MRVSFPVLTLVTCLGLLCGNMLAQVDLGLLHGLYQDLQSHDPHIRFKAFQVIRGSDEYLKAPETADRLLALLDLETREIHRRYVSGQASEDWGEVYSELLGTTWGLWRDRLTPQSFRAFAEASYNSHSSYAKELGAQAGRFVADLLPLTSVNRERGDEYTRENAVALVGYALAEDRRGAVPLSLPDRALLIQSLSRAALDSAPGPRWQVVRALKLAGGTWGIPILEKMYEQEPAFYQGGQNLNILEQVKGEIKAAMEAIRSRAGQAAPK